MKAAVYHGRVTGSQRDVPTQVAGCLAARRLLSSYLHTESPVKNA